MSAPDVPTLSIAESARYIGMTKNFLLDSQEIKPVQRGTRLFFSKKMLDDWIENRRQRTLALGLNDYAKCLDFALAMLYRGYTSVDWGTSRKREAGQTITNWTRGQLGELAVGRFLKERFDLNVELDFDVREEIVPQDIIKVGSQPGQRVPNIKVGIKATKFRNSYLILTANEVEREERKSDIYILTRINLPDDHFFRVTKQSLVNILKNERYFDAYRDKIQDFEPIQCEVVGYCRIGHLDKIEDRATLRKILGTQNPSGHRYVRVSGKLLSKDEDWQIIADEL